MIYVITLKWFRKNFQCAHKHIHIYINKYTHTHTQHLCPSNKTNDVNVKRKNNVNRALFFHE